MITGDYKETALAIARDVGIARAGDGVLSGTELDALSDSELAARCMRVSVYARVDVYKRQFGTCSRLSCAAIREAPQPERYSA